MGGGVGMFDYDNDGRMDLFFTNAAALKDPMPKIELPDKQDAKYWNRLYRQKTDGTFEDVTERAGVKGSGFSMGVAAADYDNDKFIDLYVTGYGGNNLYRNNGDGTFSDVTKKTGVGAGGWSTSTGWLDYDKDGRVGSFCRSLCRVGFRFGFTLLRRDSSWLSRVLPSGQFQKRHKHYFFDNARMGPLKTLARRLALRSLAVKRWV